MEVDQIVRKLELQENPTLLFSDIDGTLFSPNLSIITAPIFNQQTAAILKNKHIPFIIVTGRSFWRKIDQYHLKLLGLPKPDAVITANGTILYIRQKDIYISDFSWHTIMQSTKVTNNKGYMTSWNKWDITNAITNYLDQQKYLYRLGQGNTYLIRIRFNAYDVKQIERIRKDVLALFPKGIRIIFTEKLLWKNTVEIFSGEMLITPSTAGKDKTVAYLLKYLSEELRKPLHALIFGDATIDVPMLLMKENEKQYTLSPYAVHPTPLAKKTLEQNQKNHSNLHITPIDGPKEILWTLKPELRKKEAFSPAQNSKERKTVEIFEGMLDKIIDKNLSPNEVSFLGLHRLSKGLTLLSKPKNSFIDKTKGLYHYSFGNLTDILDGIRARRGSKKEESGQLVDGFADRAKEFMQLFQRAKTRKESDPTLVVQTLVSAISCALPSIARAQAEITGKTVSERDEKGGSMIDRTKRLFLSLLFTTLGLEDQSFAKDTEIFQTNIATFQHRLTYSSRERSESRSKTVVLDFARTINPEKLSDFQKKALERWLLYIDVLQQENTIIKKSFAKNPTILKEYERESEKLVKNYFALPVSKLRKKWCIKDYKLQIKDYL